MHRLTTLKLNAMSCPSASAVYKKHSETSMSRFRLRKYCCSNKKKAIDVALRPYYASHLVLLLGAMLEDPGELVVVEHPVLDGRLAVHLVHLIVGEPECCLIQSVVRTGGVCSPVPDGGEQLPQPLLVDHPRHLLVETPERILYHVFGIRALNGLYKCNEFLF